MDRAGTSAGVRRGGPWQHVRHRRPGDRIRRRGHVPRHGPRYRLPSADRRKCGRPHRRRDQPAVHDHDPGLGARTRDPGGPLDAGLHPRVAEAEVSPGSRPPPPTSTSTPAPSSSPTPWRACRSAPSRCRRSSAPATRCPSPSWTPRGTSTSRPTTARRSTSSRPRARCCGRSIPATGIRAVSSGSGSGRVSNCHEPGAGHGVEPRPQHLQPGPRRHVPGRGPGRRLRDRRVGRKPPAHR